MKMRLPSPLRGEGEGVGVAHEVPLTSILSPGGERKYSGCYFLHNQSIIV
jgi:hypothetical protein